MSWFSGSKLGQYLKELALNRDFQKSMFDFAIGVGQKILAAKDDPEKLKAIGQNLVNMPEVAVGAIVKGTSAEKLVDANVVRLSDAELAKPH